MIGEVGNAERATHDRLDRRPQVPRMANRKRTVDSPDRRAVAAGVTSEAVAMRKVVTHDSLDRQARICVCSSNGRANGVGSP